MVDVLQDRFPISPTAVSLLKWWIPFVLTPLVLFGYDRYHSLPRWWRRAYGALLVFCIAGFGALDAVRVLRNIQQPPEWDVQALWIVARVAANGDNFYDAADLHRTAEPLQHATPPLSARPVFTREILDVGFYHPPPTMLFVAPFGGLDLRDASIAWHLFLSATLMACIVTLWRVFFPRGGVLELGVVAALVLLFHPTDTTFVFGQTTFLLLLALAILWGKRDRTSSGVVFAAGMIVKPMFAFFLAYPFFRREWRTIGVCVAALAAAAALAFVTFGSEVFITYFTDNPVKRAPPELYVVNENQSLLATLLRLFDYDVTRGGMLRFAPFVVMAVAIIASTLWLVHRLARDRGELALAIAVPAALLVYPQSLEHYAALLILPMLFLWRRGDELRLDRAFVILFITAQYGLARYDYGYITVVATALQWTLGVTLGIRTAYSRFTRRGVQPALAGS